MSESPETGAAPDEGSGGGSAEGGDEPDGPDGGRGSGGIGDAVDRREDGPLLRGGAEFVDDRVPDGAARLAFVRSPHAHARVTGVDADAARSLAGVLAVYTWPDVREGFGGGSGRVDVLAGPLDADVPGHPLLAADHVRYEGQPVAAVVATDRYAARDGVAAVDVEYDPLPAVTDPVEAVGEGAPALFEAAPDNRVLTTEHGDRGATERAFEAADRVVTVETRNNRLAPVPVEPRAALADWDDAAGRLTVHLSAQNPHDQRANLAEALGLAGSDVRVVVPSVGGGFGAKDTPYPEPPVAGFAARRLGRPVAWTATRGESLRAGNHGRDARAEAALAVDDDGSIRALRVHTRSALGAYPLGAAGVIATEAYARVLTGQYDVPAAFARTEVVATNTAPVHTYRGGVAPEALFPTERLAAEAARELGLDPAAFRRRNLIDREEFPHGTPLGAEHDGGDYGGTLDAALEALGPDAPPVGDPPAGDGGPGADGRHRGVGLACYVDLVPGAYESATVRVGPDGSVTVLAGSHSHGQSHATTFTQVVVEELGVDPGTVDVVEGDTDRTPTGNGTWGSRTAVAGGSAVAESAREVAAKVRRIAAARLDCDPGSVAVEDGVAHDREEPGEGIPVADVAAAAHGPGRPPGESPGLEATTFYEPDGSTYTFGTHAAVVAVDPSTGAYEVERYVAVDDCGVRINPTVVEGQVQGSVAQGLGQATGEEVVYGPGGGLRTDSLLSYGLPRAADVPDVETVEHVTPAGTNELGARGVGEVGTIAAPPAVVNALADALAPLGVDPPAMPVRAADLRAAISGADGSDGTDGGDGG